MKARGIAIPYFLMAFSWELFEGFAEKVFSALDAQHLGRMESVSKGMNREVTSRCWETLAIMEREAMEPWLLQALTEDFEGKEALKELLEMRGRLNAAPASWSPLISSVSPCCLQLSPTGLNQDAISSEDSEAVPLVPPLATVPLALGARKGEEMAAGVRIQSKCGHANEGVWFGLEFAGVHDGLGKCMSILCAPLTGRVMLKFPGEEKMFAQAMCPLTNDVSESVEIYVRVTLPGNVEFIRVCHATSSITRSGRMPHDMFPKWAKKNFAVITIQIAEVSSKTTVSTQWAVREVLQEAQNQPEFEFDATWSMPSYIVPLILAWRG